MIQAISDALTQTGKVIMIQVINDALTQTCSGALTMPDSETWPVPHAPFWLKLSPSATGVRVVSIQGDRQRGALVGVVPMRDRTVATRGHSLQPFVRAAQDGCYLKRHAQACNPMGHAA